MTAAPETAGRTDKTAITRSNSSFQRRKTDYLR
jgi:hypothetical protein